MKTWEMRRATEQIIKTKRFFPRVAEILEAKNQANGTAVTLARPGKDRCSCCGVFLSSPISFQRGYCGPCWRKIGGEEEDARDEMYGDTARTLPYPKPVRPREIDYRPRGGDPEHIGGLLDDPPRRAGG